MTTINLREFFYWYIKDESIEVSDEVAAVLRSDKRYEERHYERRKPRPRLWVGTGHVFQAQGKGFRYRVAHKVPLVELVVGVGPHETVVFVP